MTIHTRPSTAGASNVQGTGPITIRVTATQLELMASLLFITKLGVRPYEQAAFELLTTIEEVLGQDIAADSFMVVAPEFDVIDDNCNVVATYEAENITIRV